MHAGDGRTTVLSFGYGSNLCWDRLESRLGGPGTAQPVGVGFLAQHQLRFHKRSQDANGDPQASGKGNALYTGDPADRVWGLVFRLAQTRLPALDEAEGLGHGYERKSLSIQLAHQEVQAFVYVATDILNTLVPYDWYKRLVVNGLRSWPGIPKAYIDQIEAEVPSRLDPLARRAKKELAWTCPPHAEVTTPAT